MVAITHLKSGILKAALSAGLAFPCAGATFAQTIPPSQQGPISFQNMYDNPDDLDLTLAYAKQQAENGDYLGAMGALEALLFANPNWDSARIFYAYVLFKLDDQRAVQRELGVLGTRPLTTQQKSQIAALLDEMRGEISAKSTARLFGRLEVGARYDDNAGNVLSETILSNPREGDVSALLNAHLGLSVPLGQTKNRALNLSGRYQTLRHETFDSGDYDGVSLSGGYKQDVLGASVGLNMDYNAVAIDGNSYLEETGARATVTKALSKDTVLRAKGVAYYQAYKDLPNAIGEIFRSGQNYTLGVDVEHRLKPNQTLRASLAYNTKDAQVPALRYNGVRAGAKFTHTFRDESYVSAAASYRKLNFLNATPATTPALKRNDTHIFVKASYGVPLNVVAEKIGLSPKDSFESLSLEGGVSFQDRSSNVPGFKYDNLGTEIKLVWTF